ncbi:MAG: FAD-dependent tricarballylate dehydrogenase TcuA [Pseudomonadota bacterium]
MNKRRVAVIGSGSAALCAGIAALEAGAEVTILEKANAEQAGGNSRYTAGAMRFAYADRDEILSLLRDRSDPRLARTDFGAYPKAKFQADMLRFNADQPLSELQHRLIDGSYETMAWLSEHNVRFDPIYSRQAFEKDGRYVFWGGLTLEAEGEGVGLVDAELKEFLRMGGEIRYECECRELLREDGRVVGVTVATSSGLKKERYDAVVLGCGGFEASRDMRQRLMGGEWASAKVRGTPHNTGAGIEMAMRIGARLHGRADGCHAVPMDRHMPDYGNQDIPFVERKHYRKICYFLGVMLNARGERFVDEGQNFRNYTYAQFGRAILEQPGNFAWQIFDAKVADLLYAEYRFRYASFVEADTLQELAAKLDGVDAENALSTLDAYNSAVALENDFDPTVLDGRRTVGLSPDKTNWANTIDTPPFKAYPVTCGITFTYAGLDIDETAAVRDEAGQTIPGLYACGEMVGGIFVDGYPGGSGLTSGAVFGRIAGYSAAF